MRLSYIIVTHNRREPLLRTLGILHSSTPLPRDAWDCHVVDNASTDGTIEALRERFPSVHVIARARNEGVSARNHGIRASRSRYVVLLDDDSYPLADAVPVSMAFMDEHPSVGAVFGKVVLPGGGEEACALPDVMLSGAVCVRRRVFDEVEPFRPEFFRKAGEYDVSFRMWATGWRVLRFDDVVYRHDKHTTGRSAAHAHRMDLRNNLILAHRYLPGELRRCYAEDWTQRYAAIARHDGCAGAAQRARWEAKVWATREWLNGYPQQLDAETLEQVLHLSEQRAAVSKWAREHGIRRVAVGDFGKNLFATWSACVEAGLEVTAVADNGPAFTGLRYRGLPIVPDATAADAEPDAVVLSNINPAQVARRAEQLRVAFGAPVLTLWQPTTSAQARAAAADEAQRHAPAARLAS